MSSNDTKAKIPSFLKAMESIYGPLPDHDDKKWTPPPTAEGHRGRYLWTDGFAVVNFLTLYSLTSESQYLTFARNLISTVHAILGYTRDGTSRLPGATEHEPLKGGLRIGKHDESGSDGDGQYFHYLTVWMFALNRFTFVTGETWYNQQAIIMAKSILPKFMTDCETARPRMFWKLSMDLERPLVYSEGNLDPIDGYMLDDDTALFKKIVDTKVDDYDSADTLDIGMTLWTAHWLTPEEEWASKQTKRVLYCLNRLMESGNFDKPTKRRLAFREFGTALGVRSVMTEQISGVGFGQKEDSLGAEVRKLPDLICHQWQEAGIVPIPEKQMQGRMAELMPITAVMYASALIPGMMIRKQ
ncbi:hypothetical protein H2200_004088 [Cladophialophora chaetospira]|uniref:Uncharacterized protein n=1 Tax=Cladophialophora chaetospira TaxID=386627 RepID=A0AA38XFN5_9EURO|nr:hypothetical protein H2200_004088 [Cladophialophora chaetospira]